MKKETKEEKMMKMISVLLMKADIKINFLGYKYLKTGIIYALNTDDTVMENIYIEVKKRHKTTRSNAERAIRYAIENSKASKFFNVDYKITNSVFIPLICETIKLDCCL